MPRPAGRLQIFVERLRSTGFAGAPNLGRADYSLTLTWKPPRKFSRVVDVPGPDADLEFSVGPGATVTFKAKPHKRSKAKPRLESVEGPTPLDWPDDVPPQASRDARKGVAFPAGGRHRVTVSTAGEEGAVLVSAKVRPPRTSPTRLDLRQDHRAAIVDQTSGITRLVPTAGGTVQVEDPSHMLAGAGVVVPAGALRKPTVFCVASGYPFAGPIGTRSAGPPVLIAPHKVRLKKSVEVVVPYEPRRPGVGDSPPDVSVFVRDARGRSRAVPSDAMTVDATNSVILVTTRKLGVFQAFVPDVFRAADFAAPYDATAIEYTRLTPDAVALSGDVLVVKLSPYSHGVTESGDEYHSLPVIYESDGDQWRRAGIRPQQLRRP